MRCTSVLCQNSSSKLSCDLLKGAGMAEFYGVEMDKPTEDRIFYAGKHLVDTKRLENLLRFVIRNIKNPAIEREAAFFLDRQYAEQDKDLDAEGRRALTQRLHDIVEKVKASAE